MSEPNKSSRYPNEPEHFRAWWSTQVSAGASPGNEYLAAAAWNAALDQAADEFNLMEGTSFDVEFRFRATPFPPPFPPESPWAPVKTA